MTEKRPPVPRLAPAPKAPHSRPKIARLNTGSSADAAEGPDFFRVIPQRADPAMPPGTLFGRRFEIQFKIGSGGMGVVYSAIELATGNQVAIKVLSAAAATPQNVRRFRREGQTAAAVKNRRCCRILGVGVDGKAPYIVMERLEGETLRQRLQDTGPLSAADAVVVMLQMLEALTAAHAIGVVHRDIKPGNIFLISPRGAAPSIKIIDFGLAKILPSTPWRPPVLAPDEQTSITSTDVVPGTPMYLAPEQVNGDRDLDQRVDVWAAGLTFYEMLVNKRAFTGSTYVALAKSIVLSELPSMSELRSDIPPGFDRLLAKALAKRRDQRFPTAAAFRDALLEEWALFRAAGVARGQELRKPPRPPEPAIDELEADEPDEETEINIDEPTQINVAILFDPEA